MGSDNEVGGARSDTAKGAGSKIASRNALLVLAIIVLYALLYSLANLGGPSFYGDDMTYLGLANSVVHGSFFETQYIFSVRLLMVFPIAFFYHFFGYSLLTSSAWDITCFIGIIILAFFFGRELYDENVGLVAALLASFLPLLVILSATVSDDIPMAFFTAFAMFALLMAQKYTSKIWYFATGILLVSSFVVTPEGFIITIAAMAYLLVEFLRRKVRIDRNTICLGLGILMALIVLGGFNFINSGNALITFTLNTHFYGSVGGTDTIPSTNTDPMYYIQRMFPYNLVSFASQQVSRGGSNILGAFEQLYNGSANQEGFIFYIAVLAAIYLLVAKERRAYFPMFWAAACFLYLEFGPMSIHLNPFQILLSYRLERFLTLIALPVILVVSIAIVRFFQSGKNPISRAFHVFLAIFMILFLVFTSIPINSLQHQILVYQRYDMLEVSAYLSSVPSSTRIYFASAFSNVWAYMGYSNTSRFYGFGNAANCSDIPSGAYVIVPKYNPIQGLNYTPGLGNSCKNWKLALYPIYPYNISEYVAVQVARNPFGATLYYVPTNATATNNSTS